MVTLARKRYRRARSYRKKRVRRSMAGRGLKRRASGGYSRPSKRRRFARRNARISGMRGAVAKLIPEKTMQTIFYSAQDVMHSITFDGFANSMFTLKDRATGLSSMIFRTNSIYDPYYGTTTYLNKLPELYTFFAKYYGRYKVYASKITITIQNVGDVDNPTNEYGFGIMHNHNPTTGASAPSYDACKLNPQWVTKTFYNRGSTQSLSRVDNKATLTQWWSIKRMKNRFADALSSDMGNNPTETSYFIPSISEIGRSYVDAALVKISNPKVEVSMRFRVLFSNRRDLDDDTDIIPDD